MKKVLRSLIVVVLALGSTSAFAQMKYQGEVNVGGGIGLNQGTVGRLNVETIHGIRFNPHLSAGIGLGLHNYFSEGESSSVLPIFASVKGYLKDQPNTFYASFDIGYGIDLTHDSDGGLYISPTVGYKLAVGQRHHEINIGLAYQSQTFGFGMLNVSTDALMLKVGFVF